MSRSAGRVDNEMMSRHRLSPLLDPRSLALYGASEREGSIALGVLRSLRASGFKGPIGLINPGYASVLGEPCVPTALDLEFQPELALAMVPAQALRAVVEDCADRGTPFVVALGTGFDTGTEPGRAAQAELLRVARERGVRLLGPHCMALMRPASGLAAGYAPGPVRPGRVALLSQSGALVSGVLDWAVPAGIGLSSVVALGGALDLDFGELLDWYLFDAQTESVLLYLEGVRDARRFMSSVRALSRVKPVVIMKAGHANRPADDPQTSGRSSHSDALIGNDRVFDAAIARAGAVRACTTMQLLAAARMLALRQRPTGPRLAIVANGAGPGVIAADAMARQDLVLATLSPATLTALDAAIPGRGSHRNPVNLAAHAHAAELQSALTAVLTDPAVDAALVMFVPQAVTPSIDAAGAIVAARTAAGQGKPVAAVMAGAACAAAGKQRLDEAGIPQFLTPENAVDALALLQRFTVNQQKLRQTPTAIDEGFEPDIAAAEAMRDAVLADGRTLLNEVESKTLLGFFGIAAPPSIVVTRPAQAAEAAARLGLPVVLKILSPDLVHKSDVGGVRLNLTSARGAAQAAEEILADVARLRPDARVEGIVVQAMVRTRHQREVYLGMATDPMFGAVIALGAGGIAVEQIDDVAIELPPLNALLARSLVHRIRFARLLAAYRSVPGVNFPLLEQTLVRFSSLVCACPWIASLDINPLLVDEDRVIALDARIVVKSPQAREHGPWRGTYGHLAIHPYPRELEETLTLRNGTPMRLRPVRPEDAPLMRDFVRQLSPQTLYRRFMMPVKALSDAMIERFTQIDYDRELAILALQNDSGGPPGGSGSRLAGIARFMPTWEDGTAEFAITVGDWTQGSGLGRELMHRLFAAAPSRGYRILEGIVLAENVSMLRFCERLGFTLRINPDDPGERIARRPVG